MTTKDPRVTQVLLCLFNLPDLYHSGFVDAGTQVYLVNMEVHYIKANVWLTATMKPFLFFLGMQLAEEGLSSSGWQCNFPRSSRFPWLCPQEPPFPMHLLPISSGIYASGRCYGEGCVFGIKRVINNQLLFQMMEIQRLICPCFTVF